jgi:hypothetical protein
MSGDSDTVSKRIDRFLIHLTNKTIHSVHSIRQLYHKLDIRSNGYLREVHWADGESSLVLTRCNWIVAASGADGSRQSFPFRKYAC